MEDLQPEDAQAVIKAEAIIDRRVKAKEQELIDASRAVAAIVCASIAGFLAYHSDFTGLGRYSAIWSSAIGFIVGAMVGERMSLVMFGAVVSYFITKGQFP